METSREIFEHLSGQLAWKNALYDLPPNHSEVVLASIDGVYQVVVYDKEEQVFKPQNLVGKYYSPKDSLIYWANFGEPKNVLSIVRASKKVNKSDLKLNRR
jgi:hypothetical protein